MKIAYTSVPGYGHMYPAIPLLQKLHRHKHELTIFTSEEYVPLCKSADLQVHYEMYSDSFHDLYNSGELDLQIVEHVYRETERYIPKLMQYFKDHPQDLIIHDSFAPWGKYIARILTIPAMSYALVPIYTTKMIFSLPSWYGLSHHILPHPLQNIQSLIKSLHIYSQINRKYQLKPHGFFDTIKNTEQVNVIASHPLFQPDRESLQNCVFVAPEYYTPDDHTIDKLLRTKRPVLYISLGTVFNKNVQLLDELVSRVKNSGLEVFVGADSNYEVLKKHETETCHIYEHAAQFAILKRADVFITHAGLNSVNQALMTGTPMIAIPQAADQFRTAASIANKECGILFTSHPQTATVIEAIKRILVYDKYRQRCIALQKTFGELLQLEELVKYIDESNFEKIRTRQNSKQASVL